jgi:hypothetical protein
MRFKSVGNKQDIVGVVVHNAEASATIPGGTPVCFVMNATGDGLDVVLPATGGAAKATSFAAGIALKTMLAGDYGEAQVWGFCQNVVLLRQTRSDSTGDWSSNATGFATGLALLIDTVHNCMSTAASTGASIYAPIAVLAASVATWASTATSNATADTRTIITVATKAFIRMM